jgi:hypothetical protein
MVKVTPKANSATAVIVNPAVLGTFPRVTAYILGYQHWKSTRIAKQQKGTDLTVTATRAARAQMVQENMLYQAVLSHLHM